MIAERRAVLVAWALVAAAWVAAFRFIYGDDKENMAVSPASSTHTHMMTNIS